jgi:pantetheine-phosphate adenylyltransferase
MKVALGGTFGPLHDGHKALIKRAYEFGDVIIGITSDEAARARERTILSYEVRKENLRQYIRREFGVIPEIIPLNDPYGVTLNEEIDYLIVSPETYPTGLEINRIRKENGMHPIGIVKVDHVLGEDGMIVSSTRMKRGEIDKHGRSFC